LDPVIRYDREKNADLVKTIECFKKCQHSVWQTAKELNIHKNTLNYRIRKIRELLGDENELGPQRSDIELALDIKNFIEETRFD